MLAWQRQPTRTPSPDFGLEHPDRNAPRRPVHAVLNLQHDGVAAWFLKGVKGVGDLPAVLDLLPFAAVDERTREGIPLDVGGAPAEAHQ